MKFPGQMTGEVLRHVARKPATHQYPFVPVVMPPGYRGKLVFHGEKCVGCNLCQKDCPANAIFINKVADKRFECVYYMDRCIYCGQCADSCNKDSIEMTPAFELAALSRASLKVVFPAPEAPVVQAKPPAPAAAS